MTTLPSGIIEAYVDGKLEKIGSFKVEEMEIDLDGNAMLKRALFHSIPGFRLHPVDIKKWLKSHLISITRITRTSRCTSTTSWVCAFKGCRAHSSIDGSEWTIMQDAAFGLEKVDYGRRCGPAC